MSLERKAIRHGMRDLLLGRTRALDHVFTNQAEALQRRHLPALVIHTRSEQIEVDTHSPRAYLRTARIQVEGFVEQDDAGPNDDQADDLADQVELVLLPNLWLDHLSDIVDVHPQRSGYVGVDFDVDERGIRLLGAFSCNFEVAYRTEVQAADAEYVRQRTGQFLAAGIRYDLAPPDGAYETSDAIRLAPS